MLRIQCLNLCARDDSTIADGTTPYSIHVVAKDLRFFEHLSRRLKLARRVQQERLTHNRVYTVSANKQIRFCGAAVREGELDRGVDVLWIGVCCEAL